MTARRLVVAITFIGIFAMATRVSVDTDTWWHLRAGQWILEHRAVPQTDPFSHTRSGAAWQYPGWLAEVPMYWLWTISGYAGLNLFTAFFVTLAFVFVYLTTEGDEYLRCFTLVLAAAASGVYWAARPHIVSFAFAGGFAYILLRFRTDPGYSMEKGIRKQNLKTKFSDSVSGETFRGAGLWLMPPLMLLWANIHGGFAIGFILLALTLAGETAKALWATLRAGPHSDPPPSERHRQGRRDDVRQAWQRSAWLAGITLACAAAVVVNPSGPAMLLYPTRTIAIGVLRDFIQEWQSPNFHQTEVQPFLWLLFATLGAVGLSGKRIDFTDLLLITGFGYLAFLAGRNVALFSLVAPPVLVRHGQEILREAKELRELKELRQPEELKEPTDIGGKRGNLGRAQIGGRAAGMLNWALLGLVLIAALVKVAVPLRTAVNEEAVAKQVPVGAVEFVRQSRPAGPMFNSYNWGGYLIWTLYPDYPVFVDGRTDLYDDDLLREYLSAATGQHGWQATLGKYGVNLVLIESGSGLDQELADSAAWANTFRDALAVVYERTGPAR